jgi:glutamine synthetase
MTKKNKNKKNIPTDLKDFLTFGEILENAGIGNKKIKKFTEPEKEKVVNFIKKWSREKEVAHYTHWFHPLNGGTAEKHDNIQNFSFNVLIQGEPDASSFPNGGLRDTFEARGYTTLDKTSLFRIVRYSCGSNVLIIPTVFCAYNGESLCNKLPLLRSQKEVGNHALRLLRALGNETSQFVNTCVGAEQEYFLVALEDYNKRLDLKMTGRTLFGKSAPRGQECQDHYFGTIRGKVLAFMTEAEKELLAMGVLIETRHNEVAPSQFEVAVRFSVGSLATDNNQLVMETLQRVALRHKFVCLLHEKPFAGLNGSGKHNNWSLQADDSIKAHDPIQLFSPGKTKEDMERFLLFVSAFIRGAHKYGSLLRMSAANAGNAHRLGGHEAPPAIISVFLGEVISDLLKSVAEGGNISATDKNTVLNLGEALAQIDKHSTDRNRTSPLAFTSNKFEFRMVPSSISIAMVNTILNTIVAEGLDVFATRLEKAKDKKTEISRIIKDTLENHGKIIFDGDNYSDEWKKEAKKRGLPNITSTVEAISELGKDYSIELFEKYKILSRSEIEARVNIYLEQYVNQINIEARTVIDMVNTQYIPAMLDRTSFMKFPEKAEKLIKELMSLHKALEFFQKQDNIDRKAFLYEKSVLKRLGSIRKTVDRAEFFVPKNLWPVPSYADMLFRVE